MKILFKGVQNTCIHTCRYVCLREWVESLLFTSNGNSSTVYKYRMSSLYWALWCSGQHCVLLFRLLILFALRIKDELNFLSCWFPLDLDVDGRIILKWIYTDLSGFIQGQVAGCCLHAVNHDSTCLDILG